MYQISKPKSEMKSENEYDDDARLDTFSVVSGGRSGIPIDLTVPPAALGPLLLLLPLPPPTVLKQRVEMLFNTVRLVMIVVVIEVIVKVPLVKPDADIPHDDRRCRRGWQFGRNRERRQCNAANDQHGDDGWWSASI
jgi:hypothetical protein